MITILMRISLYRTIDEHRHKAIGTQGIGKAMCKQTDWLYATMHIISQFYLQQ